MSASIVVVEHEPRYADRMKEALTGRPIEILFARDGEEALHLIDSRQPKLVVLSSVIPKVSTADLIRQIKSRPAAQGAPILITVSGYSGKNPKADAMRLGADDIVPKPFPDSVFAEKVEQLLALQAGPKLTSDQIFGDLLSDERSATAVPKPSKRPADDIDSLLDKTLSGIRTSSGLRKKSEPEAGSAVPKRPTGSGIDKLVHDTLSGLEKSVKPKTAPGTSAPAHHAAPAPVPTEPAPAPTPPAAVSTSAPTLRDVPLPPQPLPPPIEEKVTASSPVFPAEPPIVVREEPADESPDRFGQYILIDRIARGGMAEVWKARMRGLEGFEKIVAIKKILPHLSEDADFVNMFIDEAKLAAQLNHNNIIHIYDLGKIGNSYYIAMEYVEGHDLKDILKQAAERDLPLPPELALFIASKVAAALDYAHRKRDFDQKELGIVHRDVSPQNVLISAEGDIKLCDFGIAKAASKVTHTKAGALKGKLQYMSPEQAWGRPIDRRSDVFALATVLFEMLTGRKLFSGENEISVLEQVREARSEPPSKFSDEIGPEVDAIVQRALQREPEARYQSAGEMARDIDSILYTFRPTPTSADLAIYLDRLYSAIDEPLLSMPAPEGEPTVKQTLPAMMESEAVPTVKMPLVPPPVSAPPAKTVAPIAPATAPATASVAEPRIPPAVPSFGHAQPAPAKKRRLAIPIAAGLVLLAATVGAVLVVTRRNPPQAAASAPTRNAAPVTPAAQPAPVVTQSVVPIVPNTTAPAQELVPATETIDEQALIDEEVRRRLAAERTRLEQQRAQQLAAERERAASRQVPLQEPERSPAVSRPVEEPPPSAPPETATVADTRPAVPPQQTATETAPAQIPVPAVREGDLVETGTPGLIEPSLVNMKKVAYPPLARMNKVAGNVIVQALVSENGRVIDVKVLRGVPQNVGINEAAVEMVRGATFKPATKDGVRVKAYKTLVVPFKL